MSSETETKTLDITNNTEAAAAISDIKIVGRDLWRVLCKASSKAQGWMKSTKAMQIDGVGCVVQVTTQQGCQVSEALTFIQGVAIETDENGGAWLVRDVT